MRDENKLSDEMYSCVDKLVKLASEEIKDRGSDYRGRERSSPTYRKVLYALELFWTEHGQKQQAQREQAQREQQKSAASDPSASKADPSSTRLDRENLMGTEKTVVPNASSETSPPVTDLAAMGKRDLSSPAEDYPFRSSASSPAEPAPAAQAAQAAQAAPLSAPNPTRPQPGGVAANIPADRRMEPGRHSDPFPAEALKQTTFLKNARVGEAYDGRLEIEGLKSVRLSDANGSGLDFDERTAQFKGTPVTSGDFQIRLKGLLHGRSVEIIANLAVIPDPKTLWISKEPEPGELFPKAHEDFKIIDDTLLCVAASKRGRSHARVGGFRDDDCGLVKSASGGWYIAAVADGAGSAKYSRRGSKIVVDSVLKNLPPLLEEFMDPGLEMLVAAHLENRADASHNIRVRLYESVAKAARQAAIAVEDEAAAAGEKAGLFSTTLILCIAKNLPSGWFFAGFSVGDGGAAVIDIENSTLTTLTAPDSGEFAGQTRFLHRSEFSSYEEVSKRIFFDVRKRFTALILMTDGVTDPKFPTDVSFSNTAEWMKFWKEDLNATVRITRDNQEIGKEFMTWLDFWSPGNHDDRTIAVLVP